MFLNLSLECIDNWKLFIYQVDIKSNSKGSIKILGIFRLINSLHLKFNIEFIVVRNKHIKIQRGKGN